MLDLSAYKPGEINYTQTKQLLQQTNTQIFLHNNKNLAAIGSFIVATIYEVAMVVFKSQTQNEVVLHTIVAGGILLFGVFCRVSAGVQKTNLHNLLKLFQESEVHYGKADFLFYGSKQTPYQMCSLKKEGSKIMKNYYITFSKQSDSGFYARANIRYEVKSI